jgi:hypothetical protein
VHFPHDELGGVDRLGPTYQQPKLRNNEDGLPVETGQLCDDAKEVSAGEVERYDMVLAD